MIGNLGILTAFVAALISGILFFRQARLEQQGKPTNSKLAYHFYHLHSAGLIAASGYLFFALITHQFQYYYVYAHTDLSLPFKYLISAFWAGQEGTFLLWALLVAAAGYWLFKREKELLAAIMPVILLGQLFLLLFLIMENPFYYLSQLPTDGRGLNPILMDPWMVIHPPLIFISYAFLTIPFAYAIAALWKKDWQKGFLRILPWAGFGWFFLSAGILIGGAWAYRVLGWGGYWGWDPVENASLIPWLTATAMVHGLIGQKQKGHFVKSNLLLSIITYVLIILATFLTRSGVMANYSVHAFAETTLTNFIGLFLLTFFVIGLVLFFWRIKLLPAGTSANGIISRQNSFGLTMIILSVSALLVLVGTLSPVLTGLFGSPASVEEAYYLQTNTPLIFILFLLLTVCPLLTWKMSSPTELLSALKPALILLPPGLLLGYFSGVNTIGGLFFLVILIFSLLVNLACFGRMFKKGIKYSGGYLAHVGLALMLIGILGSTVYSQSKILTLSKNVSAEALGYEFTYLGILTEGDHNYLQVQVTEGEKSFVALPEIYFVKERPMRSPSIQRSILKDLYISPVDFQPSQTGVFFNLAKGESYETAGYIFHFEGFSFEQQADGNAIEVGALVIVGTGESSEKYLPKLKRSSTGFVTEPVILGNGEKLSIDKIDADQGQVRFFLEDKNCCPEDEIFVIEVKIKPLISLLILGTILLLLGMAIAVWHRFTAKK